MILVSVCCLVVALKAPILDSSMHVCISRVGLDGLLLYWAGKRCWIGEWIAWARIESCRTRLLLLLLIERIIFGGAVRDLLRVVNLHAHRTRFVLRKRKELNWISDRARKIDELTNDVSLVALAATGSQALCSSNVGSAHGCRSPDANIP